LLRRSIISEMVMSHCARSLGLPGAFSRRGGGTALPVICAASSAVSRHRAADNSRLHIEAKQSQRFGQIKPEC
jgi:hypothetical protein